LAPNERKLTVSYRLGIFLTEIGSFARRTHKNLAERRSTFPSEAKYPLVRPFIITPTFVFVTFANDATRSPPRHCLDLGAAHSPVDHGKPEQPQQPSQHHSSQNIPCPTAAVDGAHYCAVRDDNGGRHSFDHYGIHQQQADQDARSPQKTATKPARLGSRKCKDSQAF